jgi:hypothetical protein
MPVYFFDVIETGKVSRDDEGSGFPDIQEAGREALRTLGEIVCGR